MAKAAGSQRASADFLIVGRVLTMDAARPVAEALAVAGNRVQAVGRLADLEALRGSRTTVVDASGRFVLPAFHDAHAHVLKYARSRARFDCGGIESLPALQAALHGWSDALAPGAWLHADRYDDRRLRGRYPDRHDLDAAVSTRPVRVEHRGLHLAIFNTRGLEALGLRSGAAIDRRGIEREDDGHPTGRVFDGAYTGLARDAYDATGLAEDVRAASRQWLTWGVTTVQDASVTNDADRWRLFQRLADDGALQVRLVVLPGAEHLRDVCEAGGANPRIHLGPAKILVSEVSGELGEVSRLVTEVRRSGSAAAIHVVTESELVVALDALCGASSAAGTPNRKADRLEHAATVPDAFLSDLRRAEVTVVGQPGLIYERGDQYLLDHAESEVGWLHRARSFVSHGVRYAVGSDAPVTLPSPQRAFRSLVSRRTRHGQHLAPSERLDADTALRAMTLEPARCAGLDCLGVLRPGAIADITVFSPDWLERPGPEPVDLTMTDGRVVWCDGEFRDLPPELTPR